MPLGIQIPTHTISLNAKTTLTSILVSRYVISWIKLKGRGTWTVCLTFITVARFHCQPPCMILYTKAACWKCIATPPLRNALEIEKGQRVSMMLTCHWAFLLGCLTLHEFTRCRMQPMLLPLIQRHFYFVAGERWEEGKESEVKERKNI